MNSIEIFISAIHDRHKLRVQFASKKSGQTETRTCAPLDFGPSRKFSDGIERYHFWDFDGSRGPHVASIEVHRMLRVDSVNETFDPSAFVTWDLGAHPWIIERNWGRHS